MRALDRAKPNCLDAITHTCWSSPPGDGLANEDREFAQDMEMGKYHFKNKNYRGAMFRYQDALNLKPSQPEATSRLAEVLDRLGNKEEARDSCEAYVETEPSGAYGDKAPAALEQLKAPKPK
jgi:tetratricopeptide (TPR) repeat protein